MAATKSMAPQRTGRILAAWLMAASLISFSSIPQVARSSPDTDVCLQAATTQSEMARCADVRYADARRELDRVLGELRKLYAGNAEFLYALDVSQDAWQRSYEADLELRYPGLDKQASYGSTYPMCASIDMLDHALARIEFLKKWLRGTEEGDVCAGSVMTDYCLKRECVRPGESNQG